MPLYNTLASINVLALTEKAPRSALMTENLSKFFRITLNSGREFISIKEELEHLSSYLYIEKQRFGSRFDFQISSQPETESWITVRLLLQPLAENAVKHAFVGIKRKGLLTVSVKTEGNRIKYTVRDNGKGMQIGGIRDLLDREEAGYGLKYIDMRLKLYYKNDYTFHCVSVFGEGTVFTIDVPRLSEGGG